MSTSRCLALAKKLLCSLFSPYDFGRCYFCRNFRVESRTRLELLSQTCRRYVFYASKIRALMVDLLKNRLALHFCASLPMLLCVVPCLSTRCVSCYSFRLFRSLHDLARCAPTSSCTFFAWSSCVTRLTFVLVRCAKNTSLL